MDQSLKGLIKKMPPSAIPRVKIFLAKEGERLATAQKEIKRQAGKALASYERESRLSPRQQEALYDKRQNFYERMSPAQKKTYERVSGGCVEKQS